MWNNLKEAKQQLESMSKRSVMQESMINMIAQMLEDGIKGHVDLEGQYIFFDYNTKQFSLMVKCEFNSTHNGVSVRIVLPVRCCKKNRRQMEKLVNMINYGSMTMMFEYDPRDGECTVKYYHYCGDVAMSQKQADRALTVTLITMSRYEDTLIPLAMGMEPDYKKTCREYNEMKLAEMDDDEEDDESSENEDSDDAEADSDDAEELEDGDEEDDASDDDDDDDDDDEDGSDESKAREAALMQALEELLGELSQRGASSTASDDSDEDGGEGEEPVFIDDDEENIPIEVDGEPMFIDDDEEQGCEEELPDDEDND